MKTVLVVRATGHVGRPVAERLLADGVSVRLLQDVGKTGNPMIADRLLGKPHTTIAEWCSQQASAGTSRRVE